MAQKNCVIRNFMPLVLMLFLAAPCLAQDAPHWELFSGYSFKRANVREYFRSTPIIYSIRNQYENLNGWELSVTENRNRWFGGTLDVSGHYTTANLLGVSNREQTHSILYGPRFTYRKPWITPFAHLLLGVVHADAKVVSVGPHASDFAFGGAAGGGVDLAFGKRLAIRALQADYFRTSVLGVRPNSYRASAGIVFYLGKRE